LRFNNVKRVIDVDIENFYGTVKHDDLMKMLALKIKDEIFLRYITRMLKSGVMTKEGLVRSTSGLLQGSILSPVLANIYAHYVIDLWFEKVVPKNIAGKASIVRYCDDLIVMCTDTRDTDKINQAFSRRLAKFGMKLNLAKSKIVKFNRWYYERGEKQETFDFLGFTYYMSKAKDGGFTTVKVKTSKKTIRNKLKVVSEWCKMNRFKGSIRDIWFTFCRKLRGHIVYFGVTNNGRMVTTFMLNSRKIFFKWMNRRSQKRSLNWQQFATFEKQYPMPMVRIYHSMYKSI
jgi:RNA-directed DNA polymerase